MPPQASTVANTESQMVGVTFQIAKPGGTHADRCRCQDSHADYPTILENHATTLGK